MAQTSSWKQMLPSLRRMLHSYQGVHGPPSARMCNLSTHPLSSNASPKNLKALQQHSDINGRFSKSSTIGSPFTASSLGNSLLAKRIFSTFCTARTTQRAARPLQLYGKSVSKGGTVVNAFFQSEALSKLLRRSFLLTAALLSSPFARGPALAAEGPGEGSSGPKASADALAEPPRPRKVEHKFPEMFGEVRTDDYYWMRDDSRTNEEVLQHLKEENAYTEAVMADTSELQETLYKEMRGRIKEEDMSVPVRHGAWWYYHRTDDGKQYKISCRRAIPEGEGPGFLLEVMPSGEGSPPEEVYLDENQRQLESGEEYYRSSHKISHCGKLMALMEDSKGDEKYTLRVVSLDTREEMGLPVPHTAGRAVWAKDSQTLFYLSKDKLDRPHKVWRHQVGSDPSEDVCVYHEEDDAFYLGLYQSFSEEYIFLEAGSAITSNVLALPTSDPFAEWVTITPRIHGVDTSVYHRGSHFFIQRRSDDKWNSELLVCPIMETAALTTLVPHRETVKLEGVVVFQNHLVLAERENALQRFVVYDLPPAGEPLTSLGPGRQVSFDQEAYSLDLGSAQFKSHIMRFSFSSLKTPASVYDYDMVTGERVLRKKTPVLGGYDEDEYETLRRWTVAPDGVRVPISIVYRKNLVKLDGSDPCFLYGYGAYEICIDPDFQQQEVSLLDRGFVYAVAHIRGGGEMGRKWYEDGKFVKKCNTFTDFISAAEYLVANKFATPEKLCIHGRSAGGLLMGAVLNMRPDLFRVAIVGVPFVDVLTTLLDSSIPLTTIEWEEWGDPHEEKFYKAIQSYSPVDNVEAKAYPCMLVTTGLNDPRVGYWEPSKWVAKLRDRNSGNSTILLKCEFGAGHFSKSGRFEKLRETALEFSFLLKYLEIFNTTI